jgi:hypothetical protein
MAAGLGFKTFNTGDVLSAGDTNGYLMQGVLVFADAAARTTAITSPQEGQTSYLKSDDTVYTYSGTAWVAVGAGGGMTSIASGTLSGANVSLTSIAGTYKDLVLVLRDFYGSAEDSIKFRYNNDTNNNRYIQAAASGSNVSFNDDAHRFTTAAIDNSVSNGISVLEIYDYANTTHWKSHRILTYTNNATTTTNYDSFISAGLYNQDTAITRIDMFPTSGTFTAGTYTLYGVN